MAAKTLQELLAELEVKASQIPDLLKRFPISPRFDHNTEFCHTFIAMFREFSPKNSYVTSHPALAVMLKALGAPGTSERDAFMRRLLYRLGLTLLAEWDKINYPEPIQLLLAHNVKRVFSYIGQATPVLDFFEDECQKDLAVLTLRLIPFGPNKGVVTKLGLKTMFRVPPRHGLALAAYLALKTHGHRPMIALHTCASDDAAMLLWVRPQTYIRQWAYLAVFMQTNPEIKGIISNGWISDPHLASVSPALYQTVNPPCPTLFIPIKPANGKHLGFALDNSPQRQQLYKEGKYVPWEYMQLTSRRNLLAWFEASGRGLI